jgi:hypothetical protein
VSLDLVAVAAAVFLLAAEALGLFQEFSAKPLASIRTGTATSNMIM